MLHADTTAEVALLNSGSIRVDDRLVGTVLQRDVLRTLPFGGEIVHGRFRGSLLKRILDVGLHDNLDSGGYLQLSPNLEERGGGYFVDGAPLDTSRTYEVVLPQFLSAGLEKDLGFLKDAGPYTSLALRGVGGQPRNDLRDVVILYLKSLLPQP
jgi:2',3'-cyclic-nucleotide 2'-phosphodiesterase (5'-nucleotidase family)